MCKIASNELQMEMFPVKMHLYFINYWKLEEKHELLKSNMPGYLSLCYTYFELKNSYFRICLVCGRILSSNPGQTLRYQ